MILFDLGGTETVSSNFTAPAALTVFNMTPTEYTEIDGVATNTTYGDTITFEKLAYDSHYDVNCQGIDEAGVRASTALLDECGCEVTMSACKNQLRIEETGLIRAVYHGENRENILLIKE